METRKISCCLPCTLPDLKTKHTVHYQDQFDDSELLLSNKNMFKKAIHNPDIKMKKGNQTQSLMLRVGSNYKSYANMAKTILNFKDFAKNCFNLKNLKLQSSFEFTMKLSNVFLPKDLWKLDISSSLPKHYCFPYMKSFSNFILRLRALKSLRISFTGQYMLLDSKFLLIAKSISKLTSLESLTLNLGGYTISSLSLQYLSEVLSKLLCLLRFSFDFYPARILKENGMVSLAKEFKTLSKLEYLDLSIHHYQSLNETYKILAESLNELHNLKYLSLNFTNFRSRDQNNLINLAKAIENLYNLETLNFNFEIEKDAYLPNTNAFTQFFEVLGNLTKLKSLFFMIIGLEDCFIEEAAYVKEIAKLKNLERLTYFIPHKTSNEKIEIFFKLLSGLAALKKFSIRKGYNIINSFTVNSLCETLNVLENLQEIQLNFDSNENLKIESSSKLFETISKFQCLRILHIDMIFPDNISFCLGCLKKIPTLIALKILIRDKLTNDMVIEDLAMSLCLLKNLSALYLSVTKIDVEARTVILLIEQLISFENLIDLKFYFDGCNKIDQSVFEAFNKYLDQAKQLKEVSYDLNNISIKNDDSKSLKQIIDKKVSRIRAKNI